MTTHPVSTRPAFKTKAVGPSAFKVDFDERIIEGYAATWDRDLVGDQIQRGAFKRTLDTRFPAGLIKTFMNHTTPIGVPLELFEDDKGLFTRSKVSKTSAGDDALQLAADGVMAHMSIGYDEIQAAPIEDEETGELTNLVLEIKLWEFGPVVWPANEAADITGVKAFGDELGSMATRLPELVAVVEKRLKKDRWTPEDLADLERYAVVFEKAASTLAAALGPGSKEATTPTSPAIDTEGLRALHSRVLAAKASLSMRGGGRR